MKTKPKINCGPHRGHVSIIYSEGHPDGYGGVKIDIPRYYKSGRAFKKVFKTDDVPLDFVSAVVFLIGMKGVAGLSLLSSCDHFVMDVEGFCWYNNDVVGEIIRKSGDKGSWHKYVRQYGKHAGRDMWVQGTCRKSGHFVVLDNESGVSVLSLEGLLENKFSTPQEAMEFCDQAQRKVVWD